VLNNIFLYWHKAAAVRNICLFAVLLFAAQVTTAQVTVVFQLGSLPEYTGREDKIYLAGSFNNWEPADTRYQFGWQNGPIPGKDVGEIAYHALSLQLAPGTYAFKVTRGSWDKGETEAGGAGKSNRSIQVTRDTTIILSVADWADHFPKAPRRSSAGPRVEIIEKDFPMPQLGRTRRLWVYTPASYGGTKKRYPVLYMHDGQNLFEDTTSFSGEWGIDEALDSLEKMYGEVIVVGIDNGGPKRMNEYSPYDMERFGKGEGDAYTEWLVKSLRPYIKKHYRVSTKRRDTYIAGSSMGGLISLYAILKYPKVFGGAGVFSPAFWIAPSIKDAVAKRGKKVKGSIYFYAGMQEGETMVPDMLAVFNALHRRSKARMETVIRSNGKHNEATWRAEFPLFYKWLRQ
jgi:predicted alpha/beta superfamily hydrolase